MMCALCSVHFEPSQMVKKPFDRIAHLSPPKGIMTWDEREKLLDRLIVALAVEAARADHRAEIERRKRSKGGRTRKRRLPHS